MRPPFFYGWVVVGIAFVTMALAINARTAFSLLFPPILDEFVSGAGIDDVLSGASPEELIAGFVAQKLGVVAFGVRYEGDAAIQRYVLRLAE